MRLLKIFLCPLFSSRIFSKSWNSLYLLDSMFIFDRCHRSLAAVTPVKYKRDLKNKTYSFVMILISQSEKLTNEVLVTQSLAPAGLRINWWVSWTELCGEEQLIATMCILMHSSTLRRNAPLLSEVRAQATGERDLVTAENTYITQCL